MKKFWLWSVAALLLACAIHVGADTKGFFRISSSGDATITDFRSDGTVVWSNSVVGTTGKIQRTDALSATNGSWTDAHSFTATQAVMTTTLTVDTVPAGMVLVPGGTKAGTDPEEGAYSLTVESFSMDKCEVTKALWGKVYAWAITNGYSFDHAGSGKATNHPVHTVNWYDVVKWCNARSQKEGRPAVYTVNGAVYMGGQSNDVVQTDALGYRLPTVVEWEYAARGGVSSRRFPWSDVDTIQHARANYKSDSNNTYDTSPTRGYHPAYNDGTEPYTSPVGSFVPNSNGLHDMAGNVWEWCFDWYPESEGSYRVFRGGGWNNDAYRCRVGDRNFDYPSGSNFDFGFRTVLPATAPLIPTKIIRLVGDLAFGEVGVGHSATRTLTIHNDGNTTLAVANIAYPAGFSGAFGGTIAAGGSQAVTVTFSPVATQAYGGTLTVHSDGTGGTITHTLNGTGIFHRVIRLNGDLAFGQVFVGESATRTLTIHNDGNAPLTVTDIVYPTGFSGAWSGSIAAGGSRVVTVTFSPTVAQAYGDMLTVNSDATDGTATHPLGGTGNTASRVIRPNGDLAFGQVFVGESATRTLTIHNDGNAPLAVMGIFYPTGFRGPFSGIIAAGGSQAVPVTFSPTVTQSYGGTLTLNSDATGGTIAHPLSGMGFSPSGMVMVPGGTLPSIGNGVITVESFYIGKTEVTWGEWQAVRTWAANKGYDIGGAGAGCASNHPVHTVNWYGVVKWCNARSEMEGRTPAYTVGGAVYRSGQNNDVAVTAAATGYRLPTDAQWEFAARGGTQSQGYEYSGGNDINAVAWYRDNSGGAACNYWDGLGTWPVGQKGANELGIHDMSGNVWEWCFDWYPSYVGSYRVVRGGGWDHDADFCRVGYRNIVYPGDAYDYRGFRVVLPPGRQ